jgi:hypothetical protein
LFFFVSHLCLLLDLQSFLLKLFLDLKLVFFQLFFHGSHSLFVLDMNDLLDLDDLISIRANLDTIEVETAS